MLSAMACRPEPHRARPVTAPAAATAGCGLLAVVLEHQIAGLGNLRTVLLQAGQDREVALIDHLAAEALDVARTGRLFLRSAAALLLGDRTAGNGNRKQCECEEKLMHFVPLLSPRRIPTPG